MSVSLGERNAKTHQSPYPTEQRLILEGRFPADINDPSYPEGYTFIEPNYGDVYHESFKGGSSQHPMDGVYGGENLIRKTYEAIRSSPFWKSSLLVITYDEHGGFYDSIQVPPPSRETEPRTPVK